MKTTSMSISFPRCVAACLLAAFVLAAGSALGCEIVPLAAPARSETLAERQPTLTWNGVPGASYRVQVAALLPEARVVASHDVEVVGNSFRLPAALPLERAAVKVLVSRRCSNLEAQDLHAQGAWFFVDMRAACAIDGNTVKETAAGLAWERVPRAQAYSLRLFEWGGEAGTSVLPLKELVLTQPDWTAAAEQGLLAGDTSRIATVQAICDGLPGRPVAWLLARR